MVAWLILLSLIVLLFRFLAAKKAKTVAPPLELTLRLQALRRLRGPIGDAEAILERSLAGVRRRNPDKDELWCLRRVLADLDQDRR